MFRRKTKAQINNRNKNCDGGGVAQRDPVALQREHDQPKQRKNKSDFFAQCAEQKCDRRGDD